MNVLVPTHEATYSLIAPLFGRFFSQYWPDQGCSIVNGNEKWSDMMLDFCKDRQAEMAVVLLGDLILCEPIRVAQVQACWDFMLHHPAVGFFRLNPGPAPTGEVTELLGSPPNDLVGAAMFDKQAEYFVSLQPSIWRLGCMHDLLRAGETAQQFELRGTVRARDSEWIGFGAFETIVPFVNLLQVGEIDPNVMNWIKQQGN